MLKVITGLRGLTADQKLQKGVYVVQQLTTNAHFPGITAMLAAADTAVSNLAIAITNAKSGDHQAVGLKDVVEALFDDQLTKLCDYVNSVAAGDIVSLLSSGFSLRKGRQPIGKLDAPPDMRATLTNYSGVVKLRWGTVYGAALYEMEMCMGDPNDEKNWTSVGTTTKCTHEVEGLQTGKFYYFRVRAVGTAGASPMSDVAKSLAA